MLACKSGRCEESLVVGPLGWVPSLGKLSSLPYLYHEWSNEKKKNPLEGMAIIAWREMRGLREE